MVAGTIRNSVCNATKEYLVNRFTQGILIEQLLLSKLSDALDETKKLKKVDNLLTDLRNKGEIMNIGSRKEPIWQLQGIKNKLGIN